MKKRQVIVLKNLTVSDFPGIDEAKFNEWKTLHLRSLGEKKIAVGICVASFLISALLFSDELYYLLGPTFILLAICAFFIVRNKRKRQLYRELDLIRRSTAKFLGKEYKG